MKIKGQVRKFAKTTTIHGLSELLLTTSIKTKVIWGTLLLTSAGLCSWQLSFTIFEFISAPSSTKSYIKPLSEFPIVYFHIINSINYTKIEELGLTSEHMLMIYDHFPAARVNNPAYPTDDPVQVMEMKDDIRKVQEKNNLSDFGDFVRAICNRPEAIFEFWEQDKLANVSVNLDEVGISYALSKGNVNTMDLNNLRMGNTGTYIGVSLAHEFSRDPTSKPGYPTSRGRIVSDRAIFLSVGTDHHEPSKWHVLHPSSNDIILQVQMIKSLNTKQKPCSNEYEVAAQCTSICAARKSACGENCEWFTGQKVNTSTNLCTNAVNVRTGNGNGSCIGDCAALCPPTCELWSYTLQYTIREDSYNGMTRLVSITMTYLQALVFEEYLAYTSTTFFCNIGGILSLYLGASVLSFMHLLYFWAFKTTIEKGSIDKE